MMKYINYPFEQIVNDVVYFFGADIDRQHRIEIREKFNKMYPVYIRNMHGGLIISQWLKFFLGDAYKSYGIGNVGGNGDDRHWMLALDNTVPIGYLIRFTHEEDAHYFKEAFYDSLRSD